jgi:hypothetical protein
MAIADPEWSARCQAAGLESGQALVWRTRYPEDRTDDRGRLEPDPGVADKRLMVVEEEFAQVLRAAQRQGANLSAVLRQAWDGLTLHTTAKGKPATATDPHVSVIAHVTQDELRRLLGHVDVHNGFANRFLWACVRRARLLPRAGTVSDAVFAEYGRRAGEALAWAQAGRELAFDPEVAERWDTEYPILEADRAGAWGAVTARASAQVRRLAATYALLDRSATIRMEHLEAALAVWDFCDDSARYLFAGASGDARADRLLGELRRHCPMTRTEVDRFFGKHLTAAELDSIRDALVGAGAIGVAKVSTDGRDAEVWATAA